MNEDEIKRKFIRLFDRRIYTRGLKYFIQKRVFDFSCVLNSSVYEINAYVKGIRDYNVNILVDLRSKNFVKMSCTCPYFDDCKHIVAVGLTFLENNYFSYDDEMFQESNSLLNDDSSDCFKLDQFALKLTINNFDIFCTFLIKNQNNYYKYNVFLKNRRFEKSFNPLIEFFENNKSLTIKFNHYRGFSYDDVNYLQFFDIVRESGIKLISSDGNTIKFANEDDDKVPVLLEIDEFTGDVILMFNIDFHWIIVKKTLFIIYNDLIYQFILSKRLIQFFNCRENFYSYSHGFKASFSKRLNEKELIMLNIIIKELKNYFDLTGNAVREFKEYECSDAKKCIVMNYDKKKEELIIYPGMDYTFLIVNLSTLFSYYSDSYEDYYVKIINGVICHARIARLEEKIFFETIFDHRELFGLNKDLSKTIFGKNKIFNFLAKFWEFYVDCDDLKFELQFPKDKIDFKQKKITTNVDVKMDVENNFLYLDVDCYCGNELISMKKLQEYLKNKNKFIELNNGSMVSFENVKDLERLMLLLENFYNHDEDGCYKTGLYHAPEIHDFFTKSNHYNAKLEKQFCNFIEEAQSGKPVEHVNLSMKFSKILRDYQKDGIDWFYFLRKYHFAGILADDMGLGKTIQALVLLKREKIKSKPSLIVCPKTLLYNWQNESKKFTPRMKTIVVDGVKKERKTRIENLQGIDIVITSYPAMQKDFDLYKKQKIIFNYCVLDEAQFIKNYKTKNAQIVKKIDANYRLALTGTPLENSVSELWSIFDFLMPGFLGRYKSFKKRFEKPIMKQNCVETLKYLNKKVSCFMLRRTKNEVLKELPSKIEQFSYCKLTDDQLLLYKEVLLNVKKQVFDVVDEKGFKKSQIHILAALTKLRQVCNHPNLLLKEKEYDHMNSAKLDMCLELIDEIHDSKKKVLVFSQFTKMLDILAKELDKKDLKYNYLSGKTKNRQELVDDFQTNSEKTVFLISTKAGGTGLNLTAATNVIVFDPWWNPSVENQAIDRAHRFGQKSVVNVYRLITQGTIEEKIIALQKKKTALFDNIVGESKDLFTKLSWDDVKKLFSDVDL